ncbi:unnamed protein product [Rhizoctonia solani]|uniref:Uncharacterized protein n=1 Tax=Rhizoctonia solani TaxID=456999 RepID=A0A8H3AGF6_9AGAM|nr:unnamed protein product [Rhizoctonia solani]
MADQNFENSKRAYLHPKLEEGNRWVVMNVTLDENDKLEFKGQLDIEANIGAGDAEINGTFYYNELPVPPESAREVYASYFRDFEGPNNGLVRVIFAEGPGETPLGYYQSDGPIPTLFFPNDSHGPGAFIRAPKN